MKFNAFALAVSAATTIALPGVLAAGEAAKDVPAWQSACFDKDGPCNTLQQAANAARDALGSDTKASDKLDDISCYAKGAPCNVAKREALAMAEAVAEAYAIGLPKDVPQTQEKRTFRAVEGTAGLKDFCGDHGAACHEDAVKVKRAMDTVAKRWDWSHWKDKWCHGVGENCFKVKRAFDHLDSYTKA